MRRALKSAWQFLLLLSICLGAQAQTGGRDFDHLGTGFALSGAHANARCESCHVGGLFKGTPRDCESCHSAGARFAQANVVKTPLHFPTQASCETCHNARSFSGARMNHGAVARGTCASCHNRVQATGKTASHLSTTASCDTCHAARAWLPATGFDHVGVATGTCSNCHNGTQASGRGVGHVPVQLVAATAAASCDTCHRAGFKSWTPARLHTNVTVTTQCASCHAALKPGDAVHAAQTLCETCHRSTSVWTGAKVDHTTLTAATNCTTCHNGSGATGKSATHVPVGNTNCVACHRTTLWLPSSFNHTQMPMTAQCASCHTGTFPPADGKGSAHTPYHLVASAAAANCDVCHKAGYTSWTPARLHANVTVTTQCATCHAALKPVDTTHNGQTVCENCHRGTAVWTGAKVDHTTLTAATNCTTCHTGALGKGATHVPVGNTNCIACHGTVSWKPSSFNHTQVAVTAQCASCHTGTFPPADGKSAGHLPYALIAGLAAANCDACHKGSLTTWANAKVHTAVTISGQCKACHIATYASQGATAKPANHIPEAQLLNGAAMECNACHKSTTTWSQTMNHNNSLGSGSGWCKSCHASGTAYLGSMERKALTHDRRTPIPIDCSESGCHRPLGNKGSTYRNWD